MQDGVLRDFLLDAGLISRSQLESALLQAHGKSLADVLIEQGYLSEDEVRRAAAHALGVPFVVLSNDDISPDALELIPEALSRTRHMLAYRAAGEVVQVALLDVRDAEALSFLRPRMQVVMRLTDRESLRRGLLLYQKVLKKKFGDAIARDVQAVVEPAPGASQELLLYSAERLPVVYVTDTLMRHALSQRATHMHLEPREGGLLVRYRIGGALYDAMQLPRHASMPVLLRLKLLSKMDLKSTVPQEGRFKVQNEGESYVVRSSTLAAQSGERMVLRLSLEREGHRAFTLESLGVHGESLEALHAALLARKGMILVCGANGTGKTTLLYTLLDLLHSAHLSIATIEETIGMRLPFAAQTRIDQSVGLSAAVALRAALRLDPDVVMIDGVRDKDVASVALSAAKRGVLVLAALDAQDAQAGEEMLRLLVGENISGLSLTVAVRLVKKLCPHCAEEYKLSRSESHMLEPHADFGTVLAALKEEQLVDKQIAWKEVHFARAEGCKQCMGGYKGVVGLQEVVRQEEPRRPILSLVEDGIFKAANKQTSIDQIVELLR